MTFKNIQQVMIKGYVNQAWHDMSGSLVGS